MPVRAMADKEWIWLDTGTLSCYAKKESISQRTVEGSARPHQAVFSRMTHRR